MPLSVKALGLQRVELKLSRMGKAAEMNLPVKRMILRDMRRIMKVTWESEGRRGGGSWTQESEDWSLRKAKMGRGNRGILVLTGRLRDSLIRQKHPDQIAEIIGNTIRFGTRVPYAGVHQKGDPKRNIPARPFFTFTKYDRLRWADMLGTYLIDTYKRAG